MYLYFDCLNLNNYFTPHNIYICECMVNDLNIYLGAQSHQFDS